jgi:predicted metal-dependent hydrolase
MTNSITIDDLQFELRRSARRSTVGVTVDRDGSLILSAPADCPIEQIEQIAREKQLWVYKKLMQRELLALHGRTREFITGEGFWYLGRSYRLQLVDPSELGVPTLRLYRGRFVLRRDEVSSGRDNFIHWYIDHGRPKLERHIDLFAPRIGVQPTTLIVRDLKHRWGSCTPSGRLNFHWRVTLLPPRIAEYLVAHELVHLHEPNHGPAFWQRLERAMPDYADRKRWLAVNGAHYDI